MGPLGLDWNDEPTFKIELPIGTEFKVGKDTYKCAEFIESYPKESPCDYCDFRCHCDDCRSLKYAMLIPYPCSGLKCFNQTDGKWVSYLKIEKPQELEKADSFKKTVTVKPIRLDDLIGRDDVECYESVDDC